MVKAFSADEGYSSLTANPNPALMVSLKDGIKLTQIFS